MPAAQRALFVLALLMSLTVGQGVPGAQASPVSSVGSGGPTVTVVTFNVCGHAAGCGSWQKRETAIVQRIVASKADVVNVQEVWGVLGSLGQRLARHGYVVVAASRNEAIFAKASTISPVTTSAIVRSCTKQRIFADPEVSADWSLVDPFVHVDEDGNTWTPYNRSRWYRFVETCVDNVVETAKNGTIGLGGQPSAAWAMLRVKRTNTTYAFFSAHLITGKDKAAGTRATETTRLLTQSALVAEGRPRIFSGDFNSSVQRGKDTVGSRLTAAGFADSYTTSRSRSAARKYNSATGYGRKPSVGGSHIDRVFVPRGTSVSRWTLDVKTRGGKSVRPIPSDHSPVRVSIVLP